MDFTSFVLFSGTTYVTLLQVLQVPLKLTSDTFPYKSSTLLNNQINNNNNNISDCRAPAATTVHDTAPAPERRGRRIWRRRWWMKKLSMRMR